jgi:hypothetical protein
LHHHEPIFETVVGSAALHRMVGDPPKTLRETMRYYDRGARRDAAHLDGIGACHLA